MRKSVVYKNRKNQIEGRISTVYTDDHSTCTSNEHLITNLLIFYVSEHLLLEVSDMCMIFFTFRSQPS